jgi:hypothetical protein
MMQQKKVMEVEEEKEQQRTKTLNRRKVMK